MNRSYKKHIRYIQVNIKQNIFKGLAGANVFLNAGEHHDIQKWFNIRKRWTGKDFGNAPFIDQDDGIEK